MNRFLTPLKVEKVGYDKAGRPCWRLLEDLVYLSDRWGRIVVPKGFITNFASVPRLPVVFLVAVFESLAPVRPMPSLFITSSKLVDISCVPG